MADRIETLANMDSDVKAQVEEGLRESFAQESRAYSKQGQVFIIYLKNIN